MESRDQAVAELTALGFHAQHWDCYAPGSFAVASECVDGFDGIRILRHMVVVVPTGNGWSVRSEFPVGPEEIPLAEAVKAAAALVSDLREFGIPKRYLADTFRHQPPEP